MNMNRAQRRAQIRRTGSTKRRKDIALAGLSLAATTGLIGGSVSYLRPIFAYAVAPGVCTLNVTGSTTDEDVQNEINDAYVAECSVLQLTTATEVTIQVDGSSLSLPQKIGGGSFQLIANDARVTFTPAVGFEGSLLQVAEGEFTLSNLGFEGARSDFDGGAVSQEQYLMGDSTFLTIEGSYFYDNYAYGRGGAVFMHTGSLTVLSSDFVNNRTATYDYSYPYTYTDMSGGAIYADYVSRIEDSLFEDNYSGDDGGALYSDGGIGTIYNTDFIDNEAEDDGGAIEDNAGINVIDQSTFSGNISGDEGGAIYTDEDIQTIEGSTFTRNSAVEEGGAVYVEGYLRQILSSNFSYNDAGREGGAVYVSGYFYDDESTLDLSIATIANSIFEDNTADQEGGAVYVHNSIGEITLSNFYDNSSAQEGGAVYADDSIGEITSSTFEDNYSGFEGGAIYASDDIYLMDNSAFANNESDGDGGAISANDIFSLTDSYFISNAADDDGGAILADGEINVLNSSFIANESGGSGGAMALFGYMDNSEIRNSTFYNNAAGSEGRAIFLGYSSPLLVASSTIWTDVEDVYADNEVFVWDYMVNQLNVLNSVIGNNEGYQALGQAFDNDPAINYSFITGGEGVNGFSSGTGNLTGTDPGFLAGLVTSTDGVNHLPVLKPSTTSVLIDAGDPTFDGFGEGIDLLDQRGLNRVYGGRIDIGAVELQSGEIAAPATNSYGGPIVISASPRLTSPASSLVISGEKLSQVTGIKIDGKDVTFTRLPDGRLSLTLPAGLRPGKYTPVFSGEFGLLSAINLFEIVTGAVTPDTPRSVTLNYTNFIGDRSVLTAAAKAGITKALSGFTTIDKVVCTGSTSGTRATAADRRLATARAKAACDLIKQLRPEVVVELKSTPAKGVGARFRSVTLQISGS